MNHGTLIVAYHGCDATVRDDLVSGKLGTLEFSKNSYDWLGDGIYFFESDAGRAARFASASANNPEKKYSARPIVTPAVVGALLRVSWCLDMTTQEGLSIYKETHSELTQLGITLPVNQQADINDKEVILRNLDRFVINAAAAKAEEDGRPYEMVRGAFPQGGPIVASSAFRNDSHIQLALRNSSCVLGWFLCPGEKMLSQTEMDVCRAKLQEKITELKPRRRAKS